MPLKLSYKIQLLLLGALWLVVWFFLPKNHPSYKHNFLVFGTKVILEISDTDHRIAQNAAEQIELEFDAFHRRWHAWERGGLLHKINQSIADGVPIRLETPIINFLKLCQKLSAQSNYRFNPAIGKLINLWGFQDNPKNSTPKASEIEYLTKPPLKLDAISFNDNQLRSTDPRIKIDLGAIAKGYAIDLAIDTLKSLDIRHAVVNAGGDLRAIGQKNNRAWRIGIFHPDGTIISKVNILDDESVVSSGDYERQYHIKKRRVHHIINPQTGYPTDDIRAVTLIHNSATKADAAATAILVSGMDNWQQMAKKMDIIYVLVVDKFGQVHMSDAMKKRLKLSAQEAKR